MPAFPINFSDTNRVNNRINYTIYQFRHYCNLTSTTVIPVLNYHYKFYISSLILTELKTLSVCQLNDLYLELELLIQNYSETLISELALRDELEFEKELKNSFISLLLAVQNRRRQHHVEKKRSRIGSNKPTGLESKVKVS